MGDHHESWAQPNDLVPNGLLANEAGSVTQVLDQERWTIAEERTAELIACIQPNQPSEELRNAVADYVQRLIMKCFSCQVFTFGSVPLKTYLPDGDIDLTAFSKNQTVKDSWATEVRNMLESEEKSENAEFRVKEVQYIQAEVKIIKCLVENIVVDISFNQLGGLCTLCFLEEVDNLINHDHLFKRSIILIKAWCYYESRILGAHHGLISTYALETLVLYIFHVFNNSFAGPLEVLYRFLEFFSNFDWENFCVSLWGPVPIRSLPDMTAESPRKDGGELLLNKTFLDNCSSVYAVFPGGQENQGQPFVSKHFNVIDPLRTTNNLGRSVSKGNFFRIRSAFAFGAKRLARLLDCPREDITAEVNQFFMNTWERHGCCRRPDAPRIDLYHLRRLNSDTLSGSSNLKNSSSNRKKSENSGSHDSETEGIHAFHDVSYPHGNHPSESISKTSYTSAVSRTQNQKGNGNLTSTRVSDQVARNISPSGSVIEKGQRSSRPDYLVNEMQGRFQFARTRSSPELLDTSSEISSRGRRNRVPETVKSQMAASKQEYSSRRKNLGSEVSSVHGARSSTDDPSLLRQSSSHQSLDTADSNCTSNNYHDEGGLSALGEELASVSETMEMHQEEQDLVNMMASSGLHGYPSHIQMPMNLASSRLPFPISPSVLASMGYSQRNFPGVIPANLPLMEPPWGPNMQFPHGLVSPQLSHYFPNTELASNHEETVDSGNENSGLAEMNQEESEHGFWHEQDAGSARGFDDDNGNAQTVIFDDRQQRTLIGYNLGSSGRVSSSSSGNSYVRDHHKFSKESRGIVREDQDDTYRHLNNRRNDTNNSEKNSDPRPLPASHTSSSRSKASSESSWDGSSKASKSTREKRGRKTAPLVPPVVYGKGKSGWQYEGSVEHGSQSTDDSIRDWIPLSTMGGVMAERSAGPTSVSSQLQSHQISNRDSGQMNGSDSMIPMAPMLLGSGSRQRVTDNSGVVPFAFYPTGPPVPFLTMLPVYNFPAEAGNSEGSTNLLDRDEGFDNARVNQSDQNFDSAESLDQSEVFSPNSVKSVPLDSIEHRSDILNSDFASHWHNLQYGRLCQNPRYHGPLIYPSPVMVPPMYLQGHFPWDGPGRPLAANMNVFNQFLGYGPRFIPVAPLQPGSGRPGGVYQRYGDEVPRYRGGTGTYLPNPNPKVEGFRDRQPSGSKNHRGNYNYDRSDHHSDRDGNWNSSKSRSAGRNHARNQAEKPSSRLDRLTGNHNRANVAWDSYRHESLPSFHSQNGPFASSNSMHGGSSNNAYGMYPLPPANSNGVAPTGPAVPSVVMLYSYDHNVGYNSPAEQLEFGSLGPVPVSSVNEVSHHDEGEQSRGVFERQRFQGGSALSSPDQPSSPQFQRGI